MYKKKILFIIIIVLFGILVNGCTSKDDLNNSAIDNENNNLNQNENIELNHREIIDDKNRIVYIGKTPEKIISLAPSNTEVLYFLGVLDKVVGVTDFCDYPENVKTIEKIGGFSSPNLEKIISLQPDLILATNMHQEIVYELEDYGFTVIVLSPKTLDDVISNLMTVGKALEIEESAEELVHSLNNRILSVENKVKAIKDTDKPLVYYEIWPEPITTAGPDTYIDDIINIAGGKNIAHNTKTSYPTLSVEKIIEINPEIFIFSHHGSSQQSKDEIKKRDNWQDINAFKKGNIHKIDENIVQRGTPRLIDGLEEISKIIHPEIFID